MKQVLNEAGTRWSEKRNKTDKELRKKRSERVENRKDAGRLGGSPSDWFAKKREKTYLHASIQVTILIQISTKFAENSLLFFIDYLIIWMN